MNNGATRLALLLAAGCALLAACSDGGGDDLDGPKDYDLVYNEVTIERQDNQGEPHAMVIKYVKSSDEIVAKVTALFPLEVGVERDLLTDGSLSRVMGNNTQFPDMKSGKIVFDDLGEIGAHASGEFHITFVEGRGILNGKFSGTVRPLEF